MPASSPPPSGPVPASALVQRLPEQAVPPPERRGHSHAPFMSQSSKPASQPQPRAGSHVAFVPHEMGERMQAPVAEQDAFSHMWLGRQSEAPGLQTLPEHEPGPVQGSPSSHGSPGGRGLCSQVAPPSASRPHVAVVQSFDGWHTIAALATQLPVASQNESTHGGGLPQRSPL